MRALSPHVESDVVLLAGVAVVFDRIVLNDGGRLIQVKSGLLTQYSGILLAFPGTAQDGRPWLFTNKDRCERVAPSLFCPN